MDLTRNWLGKEPTSYGRKGKKQELASLLFNLYKHFEPCTGMADRTSRAVYRTTEATDGDRGQRS